MFEPTRLRAHKIADDLRLRRPWTETQLTQPHSATARVDGPPQAREVTQLPPVLLHQYVLSATSCANPSTPDLLAPTQQRHTMMAHILSGSRMESQTVLLR